MGADEKPAVSVKVETAGGSDVKWNRDVGGTNSGDDDDSKRVEADCGLGAGQASNTCRFTCAHP